MLLVLVMSWSLTSAPMAQASTAAASQRSRDTRSWYVAYEDAKKAIDKKDYQKALADLQVAIDRGPKAGRRVSTYGDGVIAFAPEYYRGLAYVALRQYANADASFKSVSSTNLITKGDKEYDQFLANADTAAFEVLFDQADKAMARQQPAEAKQLATEARAHARGTNVARLSAFASKIDNALATPPAPDPARGTPPVTPPPAAPTIDPYAPVSTPPANASSGTTSPTTSPTTTPTTSPTAPPVAPPSPGTNAANTNRPPSNYSNSAARPSPQPYSQSPSYAPPQSYAEGNAIERFYSGDYVAAASALTTLADDATLTPRGFFYLACSRAAMVLVGAAGESGLAAARTALNTAGNPSQFAADLRFISPRVRQSLGLDR